LFGVCVQQRYGGQRLADEDQVEGSKGFGRGLRREAAP